MKSRTTLALLAATLAWTGSSISADPPKPGSAEWNRRFRELERRTKELQRNRKSSTGGPRTSRQPPDLPPRQTLDERYREKMTASQRRIFDEATNPKPLDEERAPSADRCLLMFRDALNDEKTPFSTLLRCLAPWRRNDYVVSRVSPTHVLADKSDEEFLEGWRRVAGHITEIDSVRKVSGVEGWVDVWAWVEAPGLSRGLYRFRMIGEGRFYRASEYRADVIELE